VFSYRNDFSASRMQRSQDIEAALAKKASEPELDAVIAYVKHASLPSRLL
jgi:hypothetical protein